MCRWPVDPGFPMVDNRDAGNPGRGTYVVTWRATLPASLVLGNVMQGVVVVDREDREVVRGTFPAAIHKEEGKVLLVYVNEYVGVK